MEFKFVLMIICVCFMSAISVNAQSIDPSSTAIGLPKLSISEVKFSPISPDSNLVITTVLEITKSLLTLDTKDGDISVTIKLIGSNIISTFPSLCGNTVQSCPIPALTTFEAIFTLSIPKNAPTGSITGIELTFIRTTTSQVVANSMIPISA